MEYDNDTTANDEHGVNWSVASRTMPWLLDDWQQELSLRARQDEMAPEQTVALNGAIRAASLYPQLARFLSAPEILVRAADSPEFMLPDGLTETPTGLRGPNGLICSYWLRLTGLVEAEGGELLREIAIAAPMADPWARPDWRRLVVPASAVMNAAALNQELVRRTSARFLGSNQDLALVFANESAFTPALEVRGLGRVLRHESRCILLTDACFAGSRCYLTNGDEGRLAWDFDRHLWLASPARGPIEPPRYLQFETSRLALRELLDSTYEAFGIGGLIALAFGAAGMTAPIARREPAGTFPHLLVTGSFASGKSTLGAVVRALFGLSDDMGAGTTSEAALGRVLSQNAGLPVIIDDARGEFLRQHRALLLGAFAGTGRTVARYGGGGRSRTEPVDATIVLISEFEPADPALLSRCIRVRCSKRRHTEATRKVVSQLAVLARKATTAVCLDVGEAQDDYFLTRTRELADELELLDSRARNQTWPWVIAGLEFLIERARIEDETAATWKQELRAYMTEIAGDPVERSWSEAYLRDLCHMLSDRFGRDWQTYFRLVDGRLYVRFREVYGEWLRFRKSHALPAPDASENDLLDELEARGFLDSTVERRHKQRIDGVSVRVVTILEPESDDDVRDELFARLQVLGGASRQ